MRLLTEEFSPRVFCGAAIAIVAICLFIVAAFNFVVDPYAQYPSNVVPPIVQTSRAQKVELLAAMKPEPEGLVLGSSRVMKLEPQFLKEQTGLSFFNAGVNFGKPEDCLALLRYYRDLSGHEPKLVVLGIDVSAFSDHNKADSRLLANPALLPYVKDWVPFSDRFQRWRELLSWQQTKMSITSLRRKADSESGDLQIRDDGLLVYTQREREISEGTYDFQSALEYNKREYKQLLLGFETVSRRRLQMLVAIAEECSRGGCELVVFFTPMHPELYQYVDEATEIVARKRELHVHISELADKCGFSFVDLSTIDTFDGDPAQFVDGVHPLEPNTRKMIQRILPGHLTKEQYAIQ
ncbi:MAG: hypothetical protein KDB27_24355 [Planctomycetales bacterium]|nr:hypothetical protein [Planctomycetales bacterium]